MRLTYLAYLRRSSALLLGLTSLSLSLSAQSYFPASSTEPSTERHAGTWVLGGALSLWQDHQAKRTSLSFSPEVAYLFNENWGLGVVGSYQYTKGSSAQPAESLWALRPFARYYYLHREPFNLYIDGGVGFSAAEGLRGWEVGLRPGACVDLTKGLCLCLRLGFVGYRHQFAGGEEEGLGTTGFGLRFAPEELQIGLEIEL